MMSPTRGARSRCLSSTTSPVFIVGSMLADITVAIGGQAPRYSSPPIPPAAISPTRSNPSRTRGSRRLRDGASSIGSLCSNAGDLSIRGAVADSISVRAERGGHSGRPACRYALRGAVDCRDERRVDGRWRVACAPEERAGSVLAIRGVDPDAVHLVARQSVPIDTGVERVEHHDLVLLAAVERGRRAVGRARGELDVLDVQLERLPAAGADVVRQ